MKSGKLSEFVGPSLGLVAHKLLKKIIFNQVQVCGGVCVCVYICTSFWYE